MSDVTDPYAYYNMHQQQPSVNTPSGPAAHTTAISLGGITQTKAINNLDTKQLNAINNSNA